MRGSDPGHSSFERPLLLFTSPPYVGSYDRSPGSDPPTIILQCSWTENPTVHPALMPLVGSLIPMAPLGFPDSSVSKESACNAEDPGLIPGSGRSVVEGKGCSLQYSGLENSMDCIVHAVTKSRTRLSDLHLHRPSQVDSEAAGGNDKARGSP